MLPCSTINYKFMILTIQLWNYELCIVIIKIYHCIYFKYSNIDLKLNETKIQIIMLYYIEMKIWK